MPNTANLTRRQLLLAGAGATCLAAGNSPANAQAPQAAVAADFKVSKGRIKQSVMGWCFKPLTSVELAKASKEIGLVAIEGIPAADYPAVKELGLAVSLVSSHGFAKGPFNRDNHEFCATKLRESIDIARQVGCPSVITFTGMREKGITDEQGTRNCLDLWRSVIKYAEEQKINLCLEHLNSRDASHPMKGHPGYFGDDVDLCIELIEMMDSPNFKLLFDIYHVQIMHGDVIRRIKQLHPQIAHYHTAGNPGRCEIDQHQELNYPPILQAIAETGYQGYVAHEFIPTWDEPAQSLRHAAELTAAI